MVTGQVRRLLPAATISVAGLLWVTSWVQLPNAHDPWGDCTGHAQTTDPVTPCYQPPSVTDPLGKQLEQVAAAARLAPPGLSCRPAAAGTDWPVGGVLERSGRSRWMPLMQAWQATKQGWTVLVWCYGPRP